MTPKFIQIVAAGTGGGSFTGDAYLYGLTADGDVYGWTSVYDDPEHPNGMKMHYKWIKLESPS